MTTIMVVDDDEDIRLLYQEELIDEGYQVVSAASGKEALQKLASEKPDLITLDIRMNEMDGIELLGHIREKHPDLPVIICTSFGTYKQDFAIWGSDAYIIKSSDTKELKKSVKRLLEMTKRDESPRPALRDGEGE